MSNPLAALRSIGPAIIVAAVVLGPGSVLMSSRVGAVFGYSALWVLVLAIALLIAMVRLAAHIGLAYERTPCGEIAHRLGKKTAIVLGVIVLLIIACFQTSNNIAVAAALDPLAGSGGLPDWAPVAVLIAINLLALAILYLIPALYKRIENIMKALVLVMVIAFLANVVAAAPAIPSALRGLFPMSPQPDPALKDLAGFKDPFGSIIALIATTFSIAAAFYQAYLVRERGWSLADSDKVRRDSAFGLIVLGAISLIVMLTSAAVFYGQTVQVEGQADPVPAATTLKTASDVAGQLAPLFGDWSKIIFGLGILAAAISSFLVNAMIGGTIMSDSLGRGARISDRCPRNLTAAILLVSMAAALISLTTGFDHMVLIKFAQALTVLGVPALAAALIYLGTRPEMSGEKAFSKKAMALCYLGTAIVVVLAFRKGVTIVAGWFGAA